MNKLRKSVAYYNATYGTSFSVTCVFSLARRLEFPFLKDLDIFAGIGGLFIFYDWRHNPLAVFSTKDFSSSLRLFIRNKQNSAGNWVIKGHWEHVPSYVVFVIENPDRRYEKDSLRTYLISVLHPYYEEYKIIS